jgi:hypothetical protein
VEAAKEESQVVCEVEHVEDKEREEEARTLGG